jgi:hypothetical protein
MGSSLLDGTHIQELDNKHTDDNDVFKLYFSIAAPASPDFWENVPLTTPKSRTWCVCVCVCVLWQGNRR